MRGRRRRLSLGTVVVLLLCAAALGGFFAFVRTLGGDSPAAAMRLKELADSVSQVFVTPRQGTSPAPGVAAALSQETPAPDSTQGPFRPRDPISLMMTLGGMTRFDSGILKSAAWQQGGGALLGYVARQLPSDLTVLGFDHVVTDAPPAASDVFVSKAPLSLLRDASVDALVLPGIQGLDGGAQQARDTVSAVADMGIQPLGMGQQGARLIQINGLRIAGLHVGDKVSPGGQRAVTQDERAALLIPPDLAALESQVTGLRAASDLVVVSVSWDTGSRQSPTPGQSTLAHRLAQAGADMVLGYGGQQVQQVEVYQLPDPLGGQRDVLIAYSLGTLLTSNRNRREFTAGVFLHVDMLVRPEVHGVQFVNLRYTSTFTRKWIDRNNTYFSVLPSDAPPPEDMTRVQRQSMEEARALIHQAFRDTPVKPTTE